MSRRENANPAEIFGGGIRGIARKDPLLIIHDGRKFAESLGNRTDRWYFA